jgi:hypothetical protein
MLSLAELYQILESLQELEPNVERFSWGPTYTFAERRQTEAIRIVKQAIKELKNGGI